MPGEGSPSSPRRSPLSPYRPKTVVIGAGVIGLGIAWRLAQAGCPVAVYDRGEAGHGASWAAAGMLAAAVETEPGEEPLLALTLESQRLWPDFARELEAASGISVGYRDEGTMVVALTRDDAEQLRFTYRVPEGPRPRSRMAVGRRGAPARAASAPRHPRRGAEPARPSGRQPPGSPAPLPIAAQRAGARAARALPRPRGRNRRRARSAASSPITGREPADIVVLAAGAWSREIGGIPAAYLPPVRPIKGQMLALRMDPAAPLLRHVVWLPRGYLVPRLDGRLVVGGTVEERGFDDSDHRGRAAGAARRRLARGAGDRGIADRRDLGRLPPGFARRRADARAERHRRAGRSPPGITATASC